MDILRSGRDAQGHRGDAAGTPHAPTLHIGPALLGNDVLKDLLGIDPVTTSLFPPAFVEHKLYLFRKTCMHKELYNINSNF
jgi:hypothetical protein